ncbi:hypothetical protein [Spirillospora sp. NPDC029432]|uniref:hypothetical protein n=1 Tax=Spirillospora sp. NPDC029432 TaxID=3154599 RepID=UPI003455B366
MPPTPGPPGPPKGNGNAVIAVLAGGLAVLVAIGVVAFLVLSSDGGRKRKRAGSSIVVPTATIPTPPSIDVPSSAPTPTSTGPRDVELSPTFFATSVQTSRGTYRQSSNWARACSAEAKPQLAALLRRTPCEGRLRGAMYQSPNKSVYVQMTAMKFATEADARKVSRAVNANVAPKIRVAYGNEPGHWWSSSSYGNHVLIRQSFVNESRNPGSRNGPAQTYGDTLIRKFHAVLGNLYIWAD